MTAKIYVACKSECPDATCHVCGSGRQAHELKAALAKEIAAKEEAQGFAVLSRDALAATKMHPEDYRAENMFDWEPAATEQEATP